MKKIQILGKEYKIEYVDSVSLDEDPGEYSTDELCIRINKDNEKQVQEDTLLNGVIHIISDELVLELTDKNIQRLASVLYSIGVKVHGGK